MSKRKGNIIRNFSRKENRHQKSRSCDSLISKKINLKLFICHIEHKSNHIYLLLHLLFWNSDI